MSDIRQASAQGMPRPAADAADPCAAYLVHHAAEVLALLTELRDCHTPLVLAAPNGATLTLTLQALLAREHRVQFSADGVLPHLHTLLEADEALAVAYLDEVKLQFEVEHLVLLRGAQGQALQADWPRSLHRFQRRDSFRVRTGGQSGPSATLRHPAWPDMRLSLRILDLSVGGCALLLPADTPALEPGTLIHGVQVQLDMATAFVASLSLQHVASVDTHHGVHRANSGGQRLGCAWHKLAPDHERLLQCFVNQTQKRQRLGG